MNYAPISPPPAIRAAGHSLGPLLDRGEKGNEGKDRQLAAGKFSHTYGPTSGRKSLKDPEYEENSDYGEGE